MTSARTPRDVRQEQAIRALVRAGGVVDTRAGKGSHVGVTMPNRVRIFVPSGVIRTGTLSSIIKQAGLSPTEFNRLL